MPDMLQVALTSLLSAAVLFVMTKLMGNKQISQFTMFDYVVGITIGSIAAEMATELERPFHSVIAMVVYGLLAFGISLLVQRSLKARRFIDGRAWVLLDNGRLFRENFKKAHMDLGEFLALCRVQGYFDMQQLQTVVLESNGKLSFLPVEQHRPATPADLGQDPIQEKTMTTLILDGHILQKNLQATGKNEIWLNRQLHEQGYSSEEVFLGLVDGQNTLVLFPMDTDPPPKDLFQ